MSTALVDLILRDVNSYFFCGESAQKASLGQVVKVCQE